MSELLKELIRGLMLSVTRADDAYKELLNLGFKVTRAEVRKLWKEVGEKEYWSTVLETYGVEKKPPHWWIMEGHPGQSREYQYIFTLVVQDPETGSTDIKYVSALSDKLTSFQEMWDLIKDDVEAYQALKGYLVYDWVPGGILKRPS
ncbi:MAG: hypothetical protein QXT84_02055 [Candidatus Bathyarchaeia archaeon]